MKPLRAKVRQWQDGAVLKCCSTPAGTMAGACPEESVTWQVVGWARGSTVCGRTVGQG